MASKTPKQNEAEEDCKPAHVTSSDPTTTTNLRANQIDVFLIYNTKES